MPEMCRCSLSKKLPHQFGYQVFHHQHFQQGNTYYNAQQQRRTDFIDLA